MKIFSIFRNLISYRGFAKFNYNEFYGEPDRKKTALYYALGLGITMIGVTYTSVPLYRMFCQRMGTGGNPEYARVANDNVIKNMKPVRDRVITVEFGEQLNTDLCWHFQPVQRKIKVCPGETALAFYKAYNPSDRAITGIATYNIIPPEATRYFHKIQCFCFEEQRLNPKEEVDMPVFFFIDPDYDDDYDLLNVDDIYLQYTFYEAKESLKLPLPGFLTSN